MIITFHHFVTINVHKLTSETRIFISPYDIIENSSTCYKIVGANTILSEFG